MYDESSMHKYQHRNITTWLLWLIKSLYIGQLGRPTTYLYLFSN